jgi:hypothetical protein
LLAYWGILCCLSVAGWNRQLARSRKYRALHPASEREIIVPSAGGSDSLGSGTVNGSQANGSNTPPANTSSALGLTFPNLPNLQNGANVTDLLDAADKHVPTLTLNARRKFFHALAVVMFIPGVALDVSFVTLTVAKMYLTG